MAEQNFGQYVQERALVEFRTSGIRILQGLGVMGERKVIKKQKPLH